MSARILSNDSCVTIHSLKWGPSPPNDIINIAQHVTDSASSPLASEHSILLFNMFKIFSRFNILLTVKYTHYNEQTYLFGRTLYPLKFPLLL